MKKRHLIALLFMLLLSITVFTVGCSKSTVEKQIEYYTKALKENPTDSRAYYNRGNAYDKSGEHDLSLADYTGAIELDPEYTHAYNCRAFIYLHYMNRPDLAVLDYSRIIQIDPNYKSVYNSRGLAYNTIKEYKLALADFTKAIELDVTDAIAYSNRGDTYYDMGEIHLSISDYSKAIELKPNESLFYYNRGYSYHELANSDFRKCCDYGDTDCCEMLENENGSDEYSDGYDDMYRRY